jgi:hypothetical protein
VFFQELNALHQRAQLLQRHGFGEVVNAPAFSAATAFSALPNAVIATARGGFGDVLDDAQAFAIRQAHVRGRIKRSCQQPHILTDRLRAHGLEPHTQSVNSKFEQVRFVVDDQYPGLREFSYHVSSPPQRHPWKAGVNARFNVIQNARPVPWAAIPARAIGVDQLP